MIGEDCVPTGLFILLCAAAVAGLLVGEKTENPRLKRIFKPLASLAFILAAISAGATASVFGWIILAGLVLCALGDVLLLSRASASFLAGMAAFAAGHAAYFAAFLQGGVAFGPAAVAGGLGAAALSLGLLAWLWRDLGSFRPAVIAYCLIISAMTAASFAHWAAAGTPDSARLALAAVCFAVSDISVARDRFRKEAFANRLWGLPLYYAAQCHFAISV